MATHNPLKQETPLRMPGRSGVENPNQRRAATPAARSVMLQKIRTGARHAQPPRAPIEVIHDYEIRLNGSWHPASLERIYHSRDLSGADGQWCYLWCVRSEREFVGYNAGALARMLHSGRARRMSPPPQPSISAIGWGGAPA